MIQSKSCRTLVYGKKRKKIRTSRGNDGPETSDSERTGDHVPGQDPRIEENQLKCQNQKRPELPGVLDMPADY
jgi:hypothetical protein